jgi:hypothetical protein
MNIGRFCIALAATALVSGCAANPSPRSVPETGTRVTSGRASGDNVYVANQTHEAPFVGEVLIYPVGSNGNVTPSAVIAGSNTLLTQVNGIVVDKSGAIFVTNSDTNSIVGFAPGANGNVAPDILIQGANTGLASPLGLAIDDAGDLYVANCGTPCGFGPPGATSVEEFAPGGNGNVTPVRVISGDRAEFGGQIKGLTLDRKGVVTVTAWDANAALSFGPKQKGNTYPLRVIQGSQTQISSPDGVAVSSHGLYVASNGGPHITRYDNRANGNAPPLAVLSAPSYGGLFAAPDESIYVAGLEVPDIYQYAAKAKRHDSPLTTISGSNTGLIVPTAVYVN